MTDSPLRLPTGGLIDRSAPVRMTVDGLPVEGFAGDTLASALLAAGIKLTGRSFKYHRPRGTLSAGPEEPNSLFTIGTGDRATPNVRATLVEAADGLVAESQNAWPSLALDVQGLLTAPAGRFLSAGFYYKTFMGGPGWRVWEPLIRRAAGLGPPPQAPDPDAYDHRYDHCDLLVVGGGAAGLAAALSAAETGARVILCDERAQLGGRLLAEGDLAIDGRPAHRWTAEAAALLDRADTVTVLPRTTAFGFYDDRLVGLLERVADHDPAPPPHRPRLRLRLVRTGALVLATGAIEQPVVFPGNDRPGVMLAGAVRTYLHQYAVLGGRRAVIVAGCDDAYRTAVSLADAGAAVAAVVDPRGRPNPAVAGSLADRDIPLFAGWQVRRTIGGQAVRAVEIGRGDAAEAVDDGPGRRRIACDLIALSAGWAPAIHLTSHLGVKPRWDADLGTFVAGDQPPWLQLAGTAAGRRRLADALAGGREAARLALEGAGRDTAIGWLPPRTAGPAVDPRQPLVSPLPVPARGKAFVDFQNDVTVGDIGQAAREGYESVEHLKRYTTLGMGTDQGKTANPIGLTLLGAQLGKDPAATGITTFRPPYTPVEVGALAGRIAGAHFRPERWSPIHSWHAAAGAVMTDAGLWKRPWYYPRDGEDLAAASHREVRAVRTGVGLCDVTTLGKIDIQGPDAAELLNRLYINGWSALPVGRARYGVMLREDGLVWDDGTTTRLGDQHYLMTTTTAHAVPVMSWLDYACQVLWPELRVHVTSVTESWAAIAVAGPKSRRLLARVVDGLDLSTRAFPFMAAGVCRVAGVPARLFRISFSGELAYEVAVPSTEGLRVWEALMAAGAEDGAVAYGLEALAIMRIEKGHVAGPELNGRTTADDLGLGRLMSGKKDFIGRWLAGRAAFTDPGRPKLVGLTPVDGRTPIPAGAHLVDDPRAPPPIPSLGPVTSVCTSPTLGHPIALGFLERGRDRMGHRLHAHDPLRGRTVAVEIVSPHFYDPAGERMRV